MGPQVSLYHRGKRRLQSQAVSQFAFVNADAALIKVNGNIQGDALAYSAAPFVPIQSANAFVNSDIKLKRIFKGQEHSQYPCRR
jgi:hypothetical protein